MGSSRTLTWQCIALVAIVVVFALAAPVESKFWVMLTGLAAAAFFIVVSLARHQQIKRLAGEIDEVLHNGRRIDFSTSSEGDVAVLTNELQKMVARLARTTEQLEAERNALANSLADISHQIRTPLTAITFMLPSIERAENETERKRAVRKLESMIERVSWLVTALLKIAKIDAGSMRVESKPSSCAETIRRAIAPLEPALDLHDVSLVVDLDQDSSFEGDLLWTAEAVENIVKNCMEHTPAGGSIEITAREDVLATTIDIRDSGSGIDPIDLPHVFDRFYRGRAQDNEHASETSGFGVGLSLAQALVSAQEGTLRVANNPEGGAHFQIAFPKLVV